MRPSFNPVQNLKKEERGVQGSPEYFGIPRTRIPTVRLWINPQVCSYRVNLSASASCSCQISMGSE